MEHSLTIKDLTVDLPFTKQIFYQLSLYELDGNRATKLKVIGLLQEFTQTVIKFYGRNLKIKQLVC